MTTVIYHSADYDGIFCREIAKHFLGEKDVSYIGWNFGDAPIPVPSDWAQIYVFDLPLDKPFGFDFKIGFPEGSKEAPMYWDRVIWIDHHKSSIESHPTEIPGYRIDGVAACRLAWQWFAFQPHEPHAPFNLPTKQDFIDRKVFEPLAVRLAGEYDIWDKRDPDADTFQYALRSIDLTPAGWSNLLDCSTNQTLQVQESQIMTMTLMELGRAAQRYAQKIDADLVTYRSFRLKWEGLDFLCLNTGRFNSLTFAALDKPETGHDALLGFMWNGKVWTYSLYHAAHRTDLNLSAIAVKYGGGGHSGACGFTSPKQILPL